MIKTAYKCSECEKETSKWSGKCPNCNAWNTLQDIIINTKEKKQKSSVKSINIKPLSNFIEDKNSQKYFKTGFPTLDTVLGNGILEDQYVLLGGEPGIGKSTLVSQICLNISNGGKKVLYFSGEESIQQIGKRVQRVQGTMKTALENLYIINETDIEAISQTIEENKPNFVIIDSIQTLSSSDAPGSTGSPALIKYTADKLLEISKTIPTAIILIGHVTKDGNLAGPKTLEHIVDTVLNIDGDRYHSLRMIRTAKNRFGSVDEVAIFTMEEQGLKEVLNPAEILLESRQKNAIGSVLTCSLEGTRPLVTEIQALTNKTNFGYAKRTSAGIKLNRLQLICAVLQKYSSIKLEEQDTYINVVGGINLHDPSTDLAVLLALASSYKNKSINTEIGVIGEVGLSGEIRKSSNLEKRVKEMAKCGIKTILIPDIKIKKDPNINLLKVNTIKQALEITKLV